MCCHSTDAPNGPSNWFIDAPGNWMDSFYDSGLALGASWINSVAFGAYPLDDNNGFDRIHSGFPSTDPARMVAFFVAELEHRGRTQAEFADAPPFGGPLYDRPSISTSRAMSACRSRAACFSTATDRHARAAGQLMRAKPAHAWPCAALWG